MLDRLRDQHADLLSRLSSLRAARVAGETAGGLLRGAPGAAVSAAAAMASAEIPMIEAKIREMEIRIAITKEAIASNQSSIDRFEQSLRVNADELQKLDCMLP